MWNAAGTLLCSRAQLFRVGYLFASKIAAGKKRNRPPFFVFQFRPPGSAPLAGGPFGWRGAAASKCGMPSESYHFLERGVNTLFVYIGKGVFPLWKLPWGACSRVGLSRVASFLLAQRVPCRGHWYSRTRARSLLCPPSTRPGRAPCSISIRLAGPFPFASIAADFLPL